MKNFDLETLHPTIKRITLAVLKEFKVSTDKIGLCGKEGNFPFAEAITLRIMQGAGISFEYCNYALNGVPPQGCDTEFGENWNWSKMYNGAMLANAIWLANHFFTNSGLFEVGMKYPVFKKHILIKKYKLELIGTFETEWSKENCEDDRKIFYDVWQDKDKNYTFSFEKGRIGQGGYAGLVVKNMVSAVDFCKWYLSKKSFYVKDLDLFNNGLGGFGIEELKQIGVIENLVVA
jgi:hypothetical protein